MRPLVTAKDLVIGDVRVGMGETRDLVLSVSERYTGAPVAIPIRVVRALEPGPTLFVTGAIHGDELNGTGIVRHLMTENEHALSRGTVIMVPVVNVLGMEQHSRYLPDRRDLNRSFPGSANGSIASRVAYEVFRNIVKNSDYGIDVHTAATGRTNFPHIRADMSLAQLAPLAEAFGCEVILNGRGDRRTMRTAATNAGCPTLVLEAGEPLKIEPGIVTIGVSGVINVLRVLEMLDGEVSPPAYQTIADKSVWVRARVGGLLRFHITAGAVVEKGAAVATVDNLFTSKSTTLKASVGGVVIGLRTLPAVKPGDPVCHIAVSNQPLGEIRRERRAGDESIHRQVQAGLATNVAVTAPPTADEAEADNPALDPPEPTWDGGV